MNHVVCRCNAYIRPHLFNAGLCTYTTATGTVLARRLCLSGCRHFRHVVGTPGHCRVLSAEAENCPALGSICTTGDDIDGQGSLNLFWSAHAEKV